MMQPDSRSAYEEWERLGREAMLEKGVEETPDTATRAMHEEPHPLRTQDWKLEASVALYWMCYLLERSALISAAGKTEEVICF